MCCSQPQIAVLVTGSPQDQAVLHTAAQLARDWRPAGTIVLLRVVPPPAQLRISDGVPLVDLAEREADRQLSAWAAGLWYVPVRRVVLVGMEPAKEVGLWLAEHPVSAVVVPQARHGRWRRHGPDMASALVRLAAVPVVIAPTIVDDGEGTGLDVNAVLAQAEQILRVR